MAASCPEKIGKMPARPTPRVNSCVTRCNEERPTPHCVRACESGRVTSMDVGVDQSNVVCSNNVKEKPDAEVTHVAVGEKVVMSKPREEEVNCMMEEAGCGDPLLADGWSQLRFVDVKIHGLPEVVHGLNDSGAQLCVVRAEVVRSLNLPKLGEAKLRGLTNEVIPVELVSLKMRMSQGNTYCNVTCAVCEDLNNDFILGSDIVDKLNTTLLCEQCDMINVINVDDTYDNNSVIVHADDVCDTNVDDEIAVVVDVDDHNDVSHVSDVDDNSEHMTDGEFTSDPNKASAEALRAEQMADRSLTGCWSLAHRDKAGYFVRDGILYRHEKILGQSFEQLCLPYCRRAQAIKLAHETFGGHLGAKKTKARLKLSFTWPTISADVQKVCEVCHTCQKPCTNWSYPKG